MEDGSLTIFIEVSRPVQWRPHAFNSFVMRRWVWLWFAVGYLKVPFPEFCTRSYQWIGFRERDD